MHNNIIVIVRLLLLPSLLIAACMPLSLSFSCSPSSYTSFAYIVRIHRSHIISSHLLTF